MRGVFIEHCKALKDNVDYCRSSRDPGDAIDTIAWGECDGMTGIWIRLACGRKMVTRFMNNKYNLYLFFI